MTVRLRNKTARTSIVNRKIDRLQKGGSLRTLDLFAGCGGFSLGFAAAGCEIVGAIEVDPIAARSHGLNFHSNHPSHCQARDILTIAPKGLIDELNLPHSVTDAIDLIIGGPPCQAYARIGRAKLREVDQHPEAFLHDSRGNLYLSYLRYVREMCPLAIVMENVPDALNVGGHNICEEVCEVLYSEGYICGYTLLNSAFFGVPQMRERVFLFAFRKELNTAIHLPQPSHYVELPSGYEGTRAVALKSLRQKASLFGEIEHFFIPSPKPNCELQPAISARQAMEDLPKIFGHLDGSIKRGARRFDQPIRYPEFTLNPYCNLMRNWPNTQNPCTW